MKKLLFMVITSVCFAHGAIAETKTAIFAGGCFWCVEAAFQEREGVLDVISGFTGGSLPNPTYSGNHKGHYEAVQITYDDQIVDYEKLLYVFWRNIDLFDGGGQFCDRGHSYKSAIFYTDSKQRELAQASKEGFMESFEEEQVLTQVLPANQFWPVEEGHQDYYLKNPIRYTFYKTSCGRSKRLKEIWGDQAEPK